VSYCTTTPENKSANLVEVFRARCWARAHLVASGDYKLQEAVDGLQAGAIKLNLINTIGQDRVQELMASAFAPIWQAVPISADCVRYGPAVSSQQAAEYLVCLGDPKRLRAWLAEHNAAERAAIWQHLKHKRAKRCPR
jgi:hypothetical protein